MMTSSNGNIFRVTGHLCGEFTGPVEFPTQRPMTRSFDVFLDLRLNKRLNKQSWGWWFETLSHPFWRHRNVVIWDATTLMWRRDEQRHLLVCGVVITRLIFSKFMINIPCFGISPVNIYIYTYSALVFRMLYTTYSCWIILCYNGTRLQFIYVPNRDKNM